MSAAPQSPSPSVLADGDYDEVKQPAPSSVSDSIVFIHDTSRLHSTDASVVISAPVLIALPSVTADSDSSASVSDPFGPPSSGWAAAPSLSSSSSFASSADPFASSAVEPDIVPVSVDAFAAFPKPGHVNEHVQHTKKKTKKGKKNVQRVLQPVAAEAVTATSALTSTQPTAEADDGLLMADSVEYVAMLEARLEKLKKKQEARIKTQADRTTRRTSQSNTCPHSALGTRHSAPAHHTHCHTIPLCHRHVCRSFHPASCTVCVSAEFVSITTSDALNDVDEQKGQPTEEKAAQQQPHSNSAAVHTHTNAAPSASSNRSLAPHSNPPPARHRTQIGLHSAPFDEDEVQAIMHSAQSGAPLVPVVDERGEVVEDEALMASSDGDAVGVLADKTAYYENKSNLDDQNCCVM